MEKKKKTYELSWSISFLPFQVQTVEKYSNLSSFID